MSDHVLEYLRDGLGRTPTVREYLEVAYWGDDPPRTLRALERDYPEDAAEIREMLRKKF